jgi:hypothetical protein
VAIPAAAALLAAEVMARTIRNGVVRRVAMGPDGAGADLRFDD